MINHTLIILLVFILNACSSKGVYDSLQRHQRKECLQEPQSDYGECIERTSQSYEAYKRERDSI